MGGFVPTLSNGLTVFILPSAYADFANPGGQTPYAVGGGRLFEKVSPQTIDSPNNGLNFFN
jgi:hypothetical protein